MRSKILMLGDFMLGENLYHFRRGIRSKYSGRYEHLITSEVRKVLFDDIDVLFFNFEYSLIQADFSFDDIELSLYRGETDGLKSLPMGILRIANIANNHFSQHGPESARFTKTVLRRTGIVIVGESSEPTQVEINGKIIKFWGASLIPDPCFCGEYFLATYDNLCRDLSGLGQKNNDEKWVISLHWGEEYSPVPTLQQIELSEKLAGLGFDLVIGHHPHVVQPLVRYGNTLVIYSLGNFIFDQNFSSSTQHGLAVKYDLVADENPLVIITKQKGYAVVSATQTATEFLNQSNPAVRNWSSLAMRLCMKLELLLHFWEVDKQTLSFLTSRFFSKF